MRHKTGWVVAALAFVLAACSSGGSGAQKVTVAATPSGLIEAATHTAASKTGHVEMQIDTVANGQQSAFDAKGAFDADRHLFAMSLDLSSLLSATMHTPPSNASNSSNSSNTSGSSGGQTSSLGSTANVVATDDVVYLDFPLFARLVGVKTQWMSVPATTGASTFDVADPSAFLDFLHGAGGQVTDMGREEIRGVDTQHLHATVKLQDALDSASGPARDRLQRAIDQLGKDDSALLDAEMPVDVYIDNDGMVRELVFDFSSPDTTDSTASKATLTVDLSDFGTDVGIQVPPPDQVTDVTAKLAQLPQSPLAPTSPGG
jgi:hypothetical protein